MADKSYYKHCNEPGFLESKSNRISLTKFVNKLDTGDLIFSRSESIVGKIIQFSGHSIWNHVSMCIIKGDGKKYWCESTNIPYEFEDSSEKKGGVKVWPIYENLNDLLSKSENMCFIFGISKLNYNILYNNDNIMKTKSSIVDFYKRENGKPYKNNPYSTLFWSWFDGFSSIKKLCCYPSSSSSSSLLSTIDTPYGIQQTEEPSWAINKKDTTSYFCSELVVQSMIDSRMIKPLFNKDLIEIPSSEWTVADLASTSCLNNNLYNNFYYTEIVLYSVVKEDIFNDD
jgi:hypothetical protein